jgi:hypothetical protein
MKALSAGLTFVNISTVCALLLGVIGSGLTPLIAAFSLALGGTAAVATYLRTFDPDILEPAKPAGKRYASVWFWIMAFVFTIFAVRSFCWLVYIEGAELRIQSTNNLGDLALHITYIKDFANGTPLWPANPIFPFGKLRYPAGTDLFNALLLLVKVDLIRGLVWAGLAGALATFYALYRWGKLFTVAGFLFNGGIAGFQFLNDSTFLQFLDYQGDKTVAWKSLPLAMFVTQRGLLYALPAGLVLLWNWREKFYRSKPDQAGPLPFWVEVSLYASLPLFHVHTFLALTVVLVCLFVFGDPQMRGHVITLVASALLPATFFVWLITDHFHASSVVQWHPGWLMRKDAGDLCHPFFQFWFLNFGIWMPLILLLFGLRARQAWEEKLPLTKKLPEDLAFLIPATLIFILALLWKFAPWEWDNLKIMIWGYFLVLPYLWRDLIAKWSLPVRTGVCLALFGSGFVSLFGGLAVPGYSFANRGEVDAVGVAVQKLPVTARFAAFPTYNHPLLLQGRNTVLGYGGHLWTQGFEYSRLNEMLKETMEGKGDWRGTARLLGARYLFWGREERLNYPQSTHPWENNMTPVRQGDWGAIYDLGAPPGK